MQQYPINLFSVYKTLLYRVIYRTEFKIREIILGSHANEFSSPDGSKELSCADIHDIEFQKSSSCQGLTMRFGPQAGVAEWASSKFISTALYAGRSEAGQC